MTPFRLRALSLAAILFAIWIPHLSELNYGFGTFETLSFTVISVILGILLAAIGGSALSFGVILGLLIYTLLDVYFVETTYAVPFMVLTTGMTPVILRYMPLGLPLAVFLFGIVFGLPSFFAPQKPLLEVHEGEPHAAGAVRANKRYLHIILDEQMSPIVDIVQVPPNALREKVIETYADNQFRLFAHAEAIAHKTYKSLSAIAGFISSENNVVRFPDETKYIYSVVDNTLVETLVDEGFSLSVIETSYLRLCGDDPTVTCQTYRYANNLQGASELGWQPVLRLKLAYLALRHEYVFGARPLFVVQSLAVTAERIFDKPLRYHAFFMMPLDNLKIIDEITETVKTMQTGDALIAHLLVPHFPYVLDQDCTFLNEPDWGLPLRHDGGTTAATAYDAFWEQAACTHDRLEKVMYEAAKYDDMIVVIHGDHGARILLETDQSLQTDELATLLAIRGPGVQPGIVTNQVELQSTFAAEFGKLLSE